MSKALKEAIEQNDPDKVRQAAAKVKDLNRKVAGSTTPILLACQVGADKVLEALVEAGAVMKGSDSYAGDHPFAVAAGKEQTAVMAKLVEMNQVPDKVMQHVLIDSAQTGREKVLRFMIEHFKPAVGAMTVRMAAFSRKPGVIRAAAEGTGAVHATEDTALGRGLTPLHSSVGYCDIPVIQTLVACGANVNARDAIGRTPLMVLAHEMESMQSAKEKKEAIATINELVHLGADPALVDSNGNDLIDHYLFGLLWSREQSDPAVMSLLEEVGAKGSEPTFRLFRAIRDRDLNEAQKAIADGAEVNRLAPPHWNHSPLTLAVGRGEEFVRVLLEAGADVNQPDRRWTALIAAAGDGDLAVVKQLIAAGADVEALEVERPGSDGPRDNAYLEAENQGKYEVVDYLKSIGSGRPKVGAWKPVEAGIHHWNDFDEVLVKGDVGPIARALAKLIGGKVTAQAYGKFLTPGERAYIVFRPKGLSWCNILQVAPPVLRHPDPNDVETFSRDLAKASSTSVLSIGYSDTSDAASISRYEPDGAAWKDQGWDRESLEEVIESAPDEAPDWMRKMLDGMGEQSGEELTSTERLQKLAADEAFAITILGVDYEPGRPVEVTFPGLPAEAFDGVAWVGK
jgi:ankyrin repeat protein